MDSAPADSRPSTAEELYPRGPQPWLTFTRREIRNILQSVAFVPLSFIWFTRVRKLMEAEPLFGRQWWLLIVIPATAAFLLGVSRLLAAPKPFDWSKQVVLVTGGGSGVGACLALSLVNDPAKQGVRVVVLDKQAPRYRAGIPNLHTYICDVSDWAAVSRMADTVKAEVGDPTVIVNNAGVMAGKLLLDLEASDITTTFGVNTLAHFWVLKAFLPGILTRPNPSGHVVTVSSVLGVVGAAQMADYCASKAALVVLHQTLRAELDVRYGAPDVHTTLVLPGHISTGLFARTAFSSSPFWRAFTPTLTPHDVAASIAGAIERQASGTLRLPLFVHLSRVLGDAAALAPASVQRAAAWATGAHWAMAAYGPRPDAAERLSMARQLRSSAADWKKSF